MSWMEKYRPKNWEEFVGNENIKNILKSFTIENTPNLLFCGKPGVGKTTAVYIIARQFYGEEYLANVLEINSSDERGIDTIRTKIKMFCKTLSVDGKKKLLILDEADSMTSDSQHALRRVIEKYNNNIIFAFTANYKNKIIEPLLSRLKIFELKPLTEDDIKTILKKIIDIEKLTISENDLNKISKLSYGDLRKAINMLQGGIEQVLQEEGSIDIFMENVMQGKVGQAKDEMDKLLQNGSEDLLLDEVFEWVLRNNGKIPAKIRPSMVIMMAEYEYRLSVSKHPYIQAFSFMIEAIKLFRQVSE